MDSSWSVGGMLEVSRWSFEVHLVFNLHSDKYMEFSGINSVTSNQNLDYIGDDDSQLACVA